MVATAGRPAGLVTHGSILTGALGSPGAAPRRVVPGGGPGAASHGLRPPRGRIEAGHRAWWPLGDAGPGALSWATAAWWHLGPVVLFLVRSWSSARARRPVFGRRPLVAASTAVDRQVPCSPVFLLPPGHRTARSTPRWCCCCTRRRLGGAADGVSARPGAPCTADGQLRLAAAAGLQPHQPAGLPLRRPRLRRLRVWMAPVLAVVLVIKYVARGCCSAVGGCGTRPPDRAGGPGPPAACRASPVVQSGRCWSASPWRLRGRRAVLGLRRGSRRPAGMGRSPGPRCSAQAVHAGHPAFAVFVLCLGSSIAAPGLDPSESRVPTCCRTGRRWRALGEPTVDSWSCCPRLPPSSISPLCPPRRGAARVEHRLGADLHRVAGQPALALDAGPARPAPTMGSSTGSPGGDAVQPAGSGHGAGAGSATSRPRSLGSGHEQPEPPDRNLALELVRVTEAAAMAAGRWVGRGDKNGADQSRSTRCAT